MRIILLQGKERGQHGAGAGHVRRQVPNKQVTHSMGSSLIGFGIDQDSDVGLPMELWFSAWLQYLQPLAFLHIVWRH